MSYYGEIRRATKQADFIINEVLYIRNEDIDLSKVDFIESPRFECNFMKVFKKRLLLHIEGDKNISLDEIKNVVTYNKVSK